MRISTKFPIAVHTMMIIAALSDTRKITSDIIAESTGVNAVIIRTIFGSLKQAGMIAVSPGPGGTALARPASEITLWAILEAVEPVETDDIFKFHGNPSEHCPIGSNIYGLLHTHLDDAVLAMRDSLSAVTLSTLVDELRERLPDLPPIPDKT